MEKQKDQKGRRRMGTNEEEAGGGMEQRGGLMRMHRNKHGQDPM